jgi:hypothetical protein
MFWRLAKKLTRLRSLKLWSPLMLQMSRSLSPRLLTEKLDEMPGPVGFGINGRMFFETALKRSAGMRLPGNGVRVTGS